MRTGQSLNCHAAPLGQPHEELPQSWFRRRLMTVFGPADLGPEHRGNPLVGTKYDPEVKAARRAARRAA